MEEVGGKLEQALFEVRRVIAGQEEMLERVLVCLLAGGHVLIEGVPGLAKTLTIKTTAAVLGGTFQRVQFTPDLVPSDIVGRASSGPTAPTSTPAGAGRPVVSGTGKLTAFSQVRFSCFPGAPSILESPAARPCLPPAGSPALVWSRRVSAICRSIRLRPCGTFPTTFPSCAVNTTSRWASISNM